ncbi:hypothetical protein YC2023_020048 [Brassica napus]
MKFAVTTALQKCRNLNIRRVRCESNSFQLVKALSSETHEHRNIWNCGRHLRLSTIF